MLDQSSESPQEQNESAQPSIPISPARLSQPSQSQPNPPTLEQFHLTAADIDPSAPNRVKQSRPAKCHPDRRHYSKGYCKACYTRELQKLGAGKHVESIDDELKTAARIRRANAILPPPPAPVSTQAALDAGVKAEQVYSPVKPPPLIEYRDPKVAEFIARAVIVNQMDYPKAVAQIAPDLSPGEAAGLAEELQKSVQVRAAVELALRPAGLDETSKDDYVRTMWNWFRAGSEKQQIAAARILGKAFIAEKVGADKPEDLPIKGFSEGVAAMMGGSTTHGSTVAISDHDTLAPELDAADALYEEDEFDDEE